MSKYSDLCEFIHPSIDHVLLYVVTGAESGKGLCGPGGTRYILGWGGAPRPLIPSPCLKQKSLIFLPCLRQNSDF